MSDVMWLNCSAAEKDARKDIVAITIEIGMNLDIPRKNYDAKVVTTLHMTNASLTNTNLCTRIS